MPLSSASVAVSSPRVFDVASVRADFPALHQEVHGKSLVYLDSAATALKPQRVIDAVVRMYVEDCANVHRAVHTLSQRATQSYESVRSKVAAFLGAADPTEVVFLRGVTEAMNLVASAYGRRHLGPGDEIVLTGLEHHSNIVPWQLLADAVGARIVVVPIDDRGEVSLSTFRERLGPRTRVVAAAHVSNSLGSIQPVAEMTRLVRKHAPGAVVVLDGAQAVPHLAVDVTEIGCDFYAFSGHKLYGPTGAGALWARGERLQAMDPYQGGGDMIASVTFEESTYNEVPHKFEAGTPNIAGVVGLGAAIDYVSELGLDEIGAHERELVAYGTDLLQSVDGLRLIGTSGAKVGVFQFVVDWGHPTDVGALVDLDGVAIRTGHHCTQPVMERYGVTATARASLGVYNTKADLQRLVDALERAREMLGGNR